MLPSLEAKIRPARDTSGRPARLLAFAELTIAGCFIIKGIRILSKKPGEPFVVFPAERRGSDGPNSPQEWFDIAHPLTAEARGAAIRLILSEYARLAGVNCPSPYKTTSTEKNK